MSLLARPVRIICTNKGRHPARSLALVVPVKVRGDRTDAPTDTEAIRRGWAVAESLTRRRAGGNPHTWVRQPAEINGNTLHVPPCPFCGRAPRIKGADLEEVARQFTPDDAGRVCLDVSLLRN